MDDPETRLIYIVGECEPAQVGSFGADRVQVGVPVRATSRAAIAQAQPVASADFIVERIRLTDPWSSPMWGRPLHECSRHRAAAPGAPDDAIVRDTVVDNTYGEARGSGPWQPCALAT